MPFISPARCHFEQETARQAAEHSEMDLSQLTAYQRLYKSLQDDKAILKAIFGNEDKAKAKAEMLPSYADWLQGVMAGQHAQVGDKITPTVLVWFIDCGLLDEAMPLVTFAMKTGMDSADEYQRTMPEIIIEQYAEQISNGYDISPDHLQTLIDWATQKNEKGQHLFNMPDQIRAKLLKAAGERFEEDNQTAQAIALYEKALNYNPRAGVKKRLDALRKS